MEKHQESTQVVLPGEFDPDPTGSLRGGSIFSCSCVESSARVGLGKRCVYVGIAPSCGSPALGLSPVREMGPELCPAAIFPGTERAPGGVC